MRALIVDDERLARTELRRLLAAHREIRVVGEAGNVEEAARAVNRLDPDLIFLDVEMPDGTGFDLLAGLDNVPLVIFTTAYDAYALRAFEVSALDYLVKPIESERLAQAVHRVTNSAELVPAATRSATDATAANAAVLGEHHRVFVRDGDRCWFVPLGDIRLMEATGGYTRIFFRDEHPLILRSLNQLEERLDPETFFRASRTHILNLNRIASITPGLNGALEVTVEGGHQVRMSRRRTARFREIRGI